MPTTIHAKRPAVFPQVCVRCLSDQATLRKFTDTANAVVVSVTATLEIPVCERCRKAPRPWWIAGGVLLVLFLAAAVPFAMAQDNHVEISRMVSIVLLSAMFGAALCFVVARRRGPLRLVPTKIDDGNMRLTFFNRVYAERFLEANKETARIVNPWKFD